MKFYKKWPNLTTVLSWQESPSYVISGFAPLPPIFGHNPAPLPVLCGSNPAPLPVLSGLNPALLPAKFGHNQAPLPVIFAKEAQAFQI